MARVTAEKALETKEGLLDAARQVLHRDGFAGLSTRRVAAVADAPMSQIQYHFGSKEGLLVAVFEDMNAQLLERQQLMFSDDTTSLATKWDLACDYLDDDLASGYVSVLQELLAAGWTNAEVGSVVRAGLHGWAELLSDVVRQAADAGMPLGPFDPDDIAALVATVFIGAEAFLLLGMEDDGTPVRQALRRIGSAIQVWEEGGGR